MLRVGTSSNLYKSTRGKLRHKRRCHLGKPAEAHLSVYSFNLFTVGIDEFEVEEYSLRLPKYFRSSCKFSLKFSAKIMLRTKKRILQMVPKLNFIIYYGKNK